jgi:hypothetical protein
VRNHRHGPSVMGVRNQARIVNGLLLERFEQLLPAIMREAGFDMWIIVCNEDNHDPVFNTIIPWECWAPILQIVVFYDTHSDAGVERLNISLTDMEGLMTSLWRLDSAIGDLDSKEPARADSQWETLRRVLEERNPQRIGINQSDVIWAADGLTASLKDKLVATMGPTFAGRIESAEPMSTRWLETRLPAELDIYHQACAISHHIIATCFSRDVVTPGVTTREDLRWAYWQHANDLGLPVSFPAFCHLIRGPENRARWGDDDEIIRPGDMIHYDVGLKYLRILTDHQELAYVLQAGETEAPQSFQDAMRSGNRLQDILVDTWELGLTGNEILTRALARAREDGIPNPKIYSHSLSHYLHEPGPLMGLPWEQTVCPGRGDVRMNFNTAYTVELSVTAPIPEWDGEEVTFAMEQDAAFTEDGPMFLDGRQTTFHLI